MIDWGCLSHDLWLKVAQNSSSLWFSGDCVIYGTRGKSRRLDWFCEIRFLRVFIEHFLCTCGKAHSSSLLAFSAGSLAGHLVGGYVGVSFLPSRWFAAYPNTQVDFDVNELFLLTLPFLARWLLPLRGRPATPGRLGIISIGHWFVEWRSYLSIEVLGSLSGRFSVVGNPFAASLRV